MLVFTYLVFERTKKNCPSVSMAIAFAFLSKVMRHISKYYWLYDCDTLQGTKKNIGFAKEKGSWQLFPKQISQTFTLALSLEDAILFLSVLVIAGLYCAGYLLQVRLIKCNNKLMPLSQEHRECQSRKFQAVLLKPFPTDSNL